MLRLDHLSLPVRDWQKSRDWYRDHLGFEVEFEIPDRKTAAMRDDADLTVFLYEGEAAVCPGISFTIQVDDVETKHAALAAVSVSFVHPPMKVFWGYGAELCEPGRLSAEAVGSEIDEREGGRIAVFSRVAAVFMLLMALSAAGCAGNTAPSDSDKRGGFYGGISGGGTWP